MAEPVAAAVEHYERLLAEHYSWMLGGDIVALARDQADLLRDFGVKPTSPEAIAIDLGCGPGPQTLALAELGFTSVIAVDTSERLLAELIDYAQGNPAIRPIQADIRTVLPEVAHPDTVAAVVCMGDTLTHLPSREDVIALLDDVARVLAPKGQLLITYRDLTEPLHGTDRFIPVRSSEDRILTCFVEYGDKDTVLVTDLFHTRSAGAWTLHAGSYPKLRLCHEWLGNQCHAAGLKIRHDDTGPSGMRTMLAIKD